MRKLIFAVMFLVFSCIFAFAQESVQEEQEGVSMSYTSAFYQGPEETSYPPRAK